MQLKKIKLAGFKSFVDLTQVLLPSRLVAIVGPNGCGKSNIIDAVCWVMGESSAKYLRGELLTDVIFNGSSARKPVGMASVELVFDNQDASIGGEYASYAEIAIRRQISRDSESVYFLNGTRCRRRDIVDIFRGTGLGPRSYSIIGQNMISRIIEAKPEDMRVYLEEAAGVSRYKDRRRETENRIHHTKENLVRLDDVRSELETQLNSLRRQANAAEKFQLYKQEERRIRAEWLALQWREFDANIVNETLRIQQHATGLEAKQVTLHALNVQLEHIRGRQVDSQETFQEVQRRYYAIGNDITRYEQNIHHCEEKSKQWQHDLKQAEQDEHELKIQLDEADKVSSQLNQEIEKLHPETEVAASYANAIMTKLSQAEESMQEWQIQWDDLNQSIARNTQISQVEKTRLQHLEQKLASLKQVQFKLDQENKQFDFSTLEKELETATQQHGDLLKDISDRTQSLESIDQNIVNIKKNQERTMDELNQVRHQLQILQGKKAALDALQETALGKRNNQLIPWLKQHQLEHNKRLAENLVVEAGWEYAVEKVLGIYLQSLCIDDLSSILNAINQFPEGRLCVVTRNAKSKTKKHGLHTLLSKITSQWDLEPLLTGIHVANSIEEAFEKANSLAAHESIITREGLWVGSTWLRIEKDNSPDVGIFQRDQELQQLQIQMEHCTQSHQTLESTSSQNQEQLKLLENDRHVVQQALSQYQEQYAEMHAKKQLLQRQLLDSKKRADQIQVDQRENILQSEQVELDIDRSKNTLQHALLELEKEKMLHDEYEQDRYQLREQLQTNRQELNQAHDAVSQLEIRLKTAKSERTLLQQTTVRLQTQLNTLHERKTFLQNEINAAVSIESLRKDLSDALNIRLAIEIELNHARENITNITQELQSLEQRRQGIETEIVSLRDMLESLRVNCQGIKVKASTLSDQILEQGCHLQDILQSLPEVAPVLEWQVRLEQIQQRIARLGPINLVAIDEYATCSERKTYLDKQYADLTEGLMTLENAIDKIDKETRVRFKETFEKVNKRFQELFPTVFGGGRAYLELTSDNLLETGIVVMACPPGKRNSTIHLLSGGEKALTAIALIFSIFHLNPSPFCLLDEVDAPLDDANIGRFCELVKLMSDKTQFIFISHNKLAIEMAESLIGVTMHEPGVSRLVSVDVKEAMSMAET